MKKPELKCEGCKARDEIIRKLSERLDAVERRRGFALIGKVKNERIAK